MRSAAYIAGAAALVFASSANANVDALTQALAEADVTEAALALDAGADPNARLPFGEVPLARAVDAQDPALVAVLLKHRAKPNVLDAEGTSPLALACERGNAAIVSALLNAGASVRKAGPDGTSPLALCARFSSAATVARMLALGAKADAVDARGQTPLMWAASSGNIEAVDLLLKAGAKPNRVTLEGFTPLFFAIVGGAPQAADALLAAGADASYRGPENTSALQLALYQTNWRVAATLVERGADLTEHDRNGQQPLHVAAAGGASELVTLLLARGAAVDGLTGPSRITWVTEANFGKPPAPVTPSPALLVAAQNGQPEIMARLVAAGADPRFVAQNGVNVVLAAASSTSAKALVQALALAPYANLADNTGATPLHLVLGGGIHADLAAMLRVLADHGARPDIANAKGITPAQMAEKGLASVKTVYEHVFGQVAAPALAQAQ